MRDGHRSVTDELEFYLRDLPFALRRELAEKMARRVEHAKDILQAKAPVLNPANARVHTVAGQLRATVKVVRNRHSLDFEIVAGGPETTKELIRKTRYKREVKIGTDDTQNIARDPDGAGVTWDYARGDEFGTEHQPARPWFYATWHAGLKDETESGINDDIAEILGRL